MKVAVFSGVHALTSDAKLSFRSIPRLEKTCIRNPVGNKLNPLDPMFFFHRVSYGANFYKIAIRGFFKNGHMLFFCRVRCPFML